MVETAITDLDVIFEFHRDGEASEDEVYAQDKLALMAIEELEFKNMLSKEEDNMPAIYLLTVGAGGTESRDWAEMLMRMYIMWGEKNGMKVRELMCMKQTWLGSNPVRFSLTRILLMEI